MGLRDGWNLRTKPAERTRNEALQTAVRRRGYKSCHRAGAERFWSLCVPSAAKLESAGVVMAVITVMTAITAYS
jgi:hypothetical protein